MNAWEFASGHPVAAVFMVMFGAWGFAAGVGGFFRFVVKLSGK